VRFIHAADVHIDSPLVGLRAYNDAPAEQLRNATRDAFTELVTLAIDEQGDSHPESTLSETSCSNWRKVWQTATRCSITCTRLTLDHKATNTASWMWWL